MSPILLALALCFQLALTASSAQICDYDRDIGYFLTQCENGYMNAFFYWKDDCSNDNNLPMLIPEFDLDCEFSCSPGTKLGIYADEGDYLFWDSKCVACPKNSYSLGGDFVVDGDIFDWKNKFKYFETTCFTYDGVQWDQKLGCTPWNVISGSQIYTGQVQDEGLVTFELSYSAKLVKEGFIKFKYRS